METYIVLNDGIILRVYKTSQGNKGVETSLKNESISDYDEIRKIKNDTEHTQSYNINIYDKQGKVRPFIELVNDGFAELDPKFKIVGDKIIEKTLEEKNADGIIILSDYEALENGAIRPKTQEELLKDKLITQKEIDDIEKEKEIQAELWLMAVERIEAKKNK